MHNAGGWGITSRQRRPGPSLPLFLPLAGCSGEGDLLMNCIPGGYVCFSVSVRCVGVVGFFPLPFPVLSLGKRRLRRKARAGLQQQDFIHGDESSFFSFRLCVFQLCSFCFAPGWRSNSVLFRDLGRLFLCWGRDDGLILTTSTVVTLGSSDSCSACVN